jgi:GNAT superfamily N-acetyltransferase
MTTIAFDAMRAFGLEPDPAGLDRNLATFGDGAPHKIVELAALAGERARETVVGGVIAIRDSNGMAKIEGLYVAPAARGRGLGRALLERALDACAASGCTTVNLYSWSRMSAALRLYETAGWTRTADPAPETGADRAFTYAMSASDASVRTARWRVGTDSP